MSRHTLCRLLVAVVLAPTSHANRARDDRVQDEDGAALLQMKPVLHVSTESSGGRDALIQEFCRHYEWVIQEGVIGPVVHCDVIPQVCRDSYENLDMFCTSDGVRPSPHELSVFFAWTEQWCSEVADPSLINLCVIDPEELSETPCREQVDMDHLMTYNNVHHDDLKSVEGICQQVFGEGGECYHLWQSVQEEVAFMQWKTLEFQGDLGKYAGLVHSFLELETAAGQRYSLEVFPLPGSDRASTWTSWMKNGPKDGNVHAAAGGELLKPGLSVADVIKQMNRDKEEYNLLSNNCHHIVSRVFEWAAPSAKETSMPNPKWSALTTSLLKSAPQATGALGDILTRAGVGCFAAGTPPVGVPAPPPTTTTTTTRFGGDTPTVPRLKASESDFGK